MNNMGGFLFKNLVFGPVRSRRLGRSLGLNLLPVNAKWCNFNCIYCECGLTARYDNSDIFPAAADIVSELQHVLTHQSNIGECIDAITFAGNGEPSLHPDFLFITQKVIELRNQLAPKAVVAVLTNATTLNNADVVKALGCVDKPILKLDTAIQETFELLNKCFEPLHIQQIINDIAAFPHKKIVQTMFVRGQFGGRSIDNTTSTELDAYIGALKCIQPDEVMIYSIDRETPEQGLQKISVDELQAIKTKIEAGGFRVMLTP